MKEYDCQQLRNVGVLGHNGVGKTSLVEALLYNAGVISRLGTINDGNTVSDFDPEEIKRKISIHATLAPLEYNNHKINLIDTPGYIDFIGEVLSTLRVVEGALMLFDAVNTTGVGSEAFWKQVNKNNLPRIIFINRLDKERANFEATVNTLRDKFGKHLTPVMIPIGAEAGFKGVVDIVTHKAYLFEGKGLKECEIPKEAADLIPSYKEMLLEAVAEVDDTLLQEYLDNKEISQEEISQALIKGVQEGKVVPIFGGSASKNLGPQLLPEVILKWFPHPCQREAEGSDPNTKKTIKRQPTATEPFSSYVFKTIIEPHMGEISYIRLYSGTLTSGSSVHNVNRAGVERIGQILITCGKTRTEVGKASAGDLVALPKLKNTRTSDTLCNTHSPILYPEADMPQSTVSLAVRPKSKADQEKMALGLSSFTREDPTFKMHYDPETKETIISGMGDVHLEIFLRKFKERYGVEIETSPPRIPYKETIHSKAKAQGKYKKQTGGRGQYGDTWIDIEPLPRGRGIEFVDKIVGGAIPRNYIPSVEKGIREAAEGGVIAGYPTVDFKVTLYDGSYHEVDSSDMAFKIAGSMGFKKAFQEAHPVVLEPIVHIEVSVPPQYVGEVVSDLNKRHGHIGSIKEDGVTAQVPLAEISKYSTDLRSFTHGTGSYTTQFSHYQEVMPKTQQDLMAKYQAEREKGGRAEV
jgi:elongation factor G